MSLEIGEKAPDFSLVADNGKPYKLSSKVKDKVLLVFYPGDGTPICTKQMVDYKNSLAEFNQLDVEIIGVSSNDPESHKAFKKENDLPFTLLSDSEGKVAEQYDSMGWFGIKRAVFLLDKSLNVKYKHIEPVSIFNRTSEELISAIKSAE